MASGFFEVLALKSKKDKEKTQRMLVAFARLLTQYFKDFRPKTMWGSVPFGYNNIDYEFIIYKKLSAGSRRGFLAVLLDKANGA